MSGTQYRAVVLGNAVTWFLVGMHVPGVHEITSHGAAPRWDVLAATAALIGLGIWMLFVLLRRTPRPR